MLKRLPSPEEQSSNEDLFDKKQKRLLKHLVLHDHLSYCRWSMRERLGFKIETAPFHKVMCDTLDRVISGEISRLIISVSPGYSKSEMAVIGFISRGLAINPRAKFLHLSYSDDLAMQNSSSIKEVVESDYFQELFPMKLKADSKSKKIWWNEEGGGLRAAASGGSITGFRAGQYGDGFTGAMVIDDPLKPEDAFSTPTREKINNRFMNTYKSRLMHNDIPIILIMQRIHEDDPTAHLLRGGSGEKWHHLLLPAIIGDEIEEYPSEYTHGIPIKHDLPKGALWEYKQTEESIKKMDYADPYTCASQYMQTPVPLGGGMFKAEFWSFYNPSQPPSFEYLYMTADTAQKTGEHNDYSVIQCWGVHKGGIYLVDMLRGKWEAPELEEQVKSFIRFHYGTGVQVVGRLRSFNIEDKSSGTGLAQSLQRWDECKITINPIPRNKDKVSRANDFVPFVAAGKVHLPEGKSFLQDFILEFSKFTALMTHANDDIVDATLDAIQIGLAPAKKTSGTW